MVWLYVVVGILSFVFVTYWAWRFYLIVAGIDNETH